MQSAHTHLTSSFIGNTGFINCSTRTNCNGCFYFTYRPPNRRNTETLCMGKGEGVGKRNKLSDLPNSHRPFNKRRPLTDDGARRVIKERAAFESQLRKNNPNASAYKWFRRSPSQMAEFLANGRVAYRYSKNVDSAIRTVRNLSNKPRDSYDFALVMNPWVGLLSFKEMCIVLKEQKHWAQACDFFQWMKRQGCYMPSVIPYTILFRILGQAGRIEHIQSLYSEMLGEGCEPDEVVICSLICVFGRSGHTASMMDLYSMMHSQGLTPPIVVFNFMLSSLYKAGLYTDAINLWDDIRSSSVMPTDYTYGVIFNAYRKAETYGEALNVFDEMIRAGHLPDEIIYNMVINMMTELGKQDGILDIYERMKLQGLVLTKYTYTSLVHSFSQAGKYKLAVRFFSEMQKQGYAMDEVIYGTIISIYSKLGMYEDAEETFKEMDDAGLVVTERIFIIMATVRMKCCKYSKALELFDEMQSRGFKMTKYAWIIVLQCCVKQNKLNHAESVFEIMLKNGFADAAAYTCMFSLYKKLHLFDATEILLSNLESSQVKPDEKLYGAIINHFCVSNLISDAERYFSEMQIRGLIPTRAIKTMLIQAYGKTGRLVDAESLYASLDENDSKSISVMLKLYDSYGMKQEAEELSKQLVEFNLTNNREWM